MGQTRSTIQLKLLFTLLTLASLLQITMGDPEQVEDEESEESNNSEVAHGFGAAKHFMPLPHTVVGAHCTWQLRLNTVPARIPETITEVLCHSPGDRCGGSMYYSCKQMKAKMLVAHTEPVLVEDSYDWRVRAVRNITVNIGCSCVYRAPVLLDEFFPGPQEKRKRSQGGGWGSQGGGPEAWPGIARKKREAALYSGPMTMLAETVTMEEEVEAAREGVEGEEAAREGLDEEEDTINKTEGEVHNNKTETVTEGMSAGGQTVTASG